jgi:hypothetical protein
MFDALTVLAVLVVWLILQIMVQRAGKFAQRTLQDVYLCSAEKRLRTWRPAVRRI